MQERILLLGDSLIAHFDWQHVFPDMDCVNLGVPGETVGGWSALTQQAWARYPEAQYLLIMLGANNLWQQDYSFMVQYRDLLADLLRLYPRTEIVVCSLLPHELSWLGSSAVLRLNEMLRGMVVKQGCSFLDLCSAFLAHGSGCFMADGVHLSKKGYELWCHELEKWLHLKSSTK